MFSYYLSTYETVEDKEGHLRTMFIDLFSENLGSVEPYVSSIGE